MYRRALVPTDGSELSHTALAHVPRVATSAVLILVPRDVARLLAEASPPVELDQATADRWRESGLTEAREQLSTLKAELEGAGLDDVQTVVGEGAPGDAIVRAASEQDCDVIVMATHGRSGIRRLMLGSVAQYVAQHAEDAAVLLVRP